MSVKNFKFVSPGVFINEIDNSFRPRENDAIGPVVIGRAQRGPALRPVTVQSYSDFLEVFGDTVAGGGSPEGDVYRKGNTMSPMYGTYAAKAFLNANVAPLTYIRLLGEQDANNTSDLDAEAGWQTHNGTNATNPVKGSSAGGAFGFWIAPSSSNGAFRTSTNGEFRLGGIIYVDSGSVQLNGTVAGDAGAPDTAQGSCTLIESDAAGNFKLRIAGNTDGNKDFTVNFNSDSEFYIRDVLNTNPQLVTTKGEFYPSGSFKDYWLGETYDQFLRDNSLQGGGSTTLVGCITGLASGSAATVGPHNMKDAPYQNAVAGWFIGQDLGLYSSFNPANAPKLFRLIGLENAESLHKNVKVSIGRIRASTSTSNKYGTFSVILRAIGDTDNNVVVLERFDNCNLDPSSPDYLGRKIGDKYERWDTTERRLRTYGDYENQSKYVRVEIDTDVEAGATDPVLLPFGYFGPPKFDDLFMEALTGSNLRNSDNSFIKLGETVPGAPFTGTGTGAFLLSSSYNTSSADFRFPEVRLRSSSVDGGLTDARNAYFGMQTTRDASSTFSDEGIGDYHRLPYIDLAQTTNVAQDVSSGTFGGLANYCYIFTLDNVRSSSAGIYNYESGSRTAGTSITADGGNTYSTLLNAGYDKFTAPFFGGFDALDIKKPDPFYNLGMASGAETTNYAYYTIKRALDTVADPEYINMNTLVVPGITNTKLTTHAINVCAERGDAMALIDLPDVYIPSHERYYADKTNRIGTTPTNAATALRDRRIDSSYGATFYPWVQTRDESSGKLLWIPPTVAMLGVLASTERNAAVWFAPAGFNRGGLTDGAAGIPVTSVSERLSSKERDTLYEDRINPIASFPSSGIVVFGQKTLQERASALDRINVRRLVIFLKKQISIVSTQVLFEQNVQDTWNRFKGLVEPILADVQARFGITGYRLILDDTTTTPDLVDQNVLYAKIMVKPARAIEFIAIDFVVMNTGASFDD